jgi:hypothetical protein
MRTSNAIERVNKELKRRKQQYSAKSQTNGSSAKYTST